MEWLNEPASWQRTDDVLQVNVDPGTDFWRVTGYGYIRDSGHVYGEVLAGDLDVAVRVRGNWASQYDQAGVMLRADERTWLKTGVEYFEGKPRLSTVLTLGLSSWAVASLPDNTDEIALRLTRRGDAVVIRYAIGAVRGAKSAARLSMRAPVRKLVISAAEDRLPGIRAVLSDVQAAGKVDQVVLVPSACPEPVHHITL